MKFLLKLGYLFLTVFILINSISTHTMDRKVENPKYEYGSGEDYYIEYEETDVFISLWDRFDIYDEACVIVETSDEEIYLNAVPYDDQDSILSNASRVYLSEKKHRDFHFEGIFIIILYVLFLIIIPIICFISSWKNAKIRKKNTINARIDEFYDKCISLNINSIETDEEKEKLLLVAKNFGYTTMEEAIRNYKAGVELQKEHIEEEKQFKIAEQRKQELQLKQDIEKLRNEERQKYLAERAFSEKTGKNKYISVINDEISRLQSEYKEIEKIDPYTPFMKHKKDNWGWIGGIADGIAGPGAGVMAAAEAHERNVNYNNAVDQYNKSLILNGYDPTKVEKAKNDKLKRIENKMNELKEYINSIDKALINDDVIKSDFNKVSFTVSGSVTDKTSNLLLDVTVKVNEPTTLLGYQAIIDGCVLISVLNEKNQKVGDAYYNTEYEKPYEIKKAGFNNAKTRWVYAIPCGKNHFNKNEKYHYEVTPISIWTIEVVR